MEENKDYRAYRYGDHLEPGAELKIEHSVSCEDVDISSLITMGAENLEAMRQGSIDGEQKAYEIVVAAAKQWEKQAAATQMINRALSYLRTPEVTHTANEWRKTDNWRNDEEISNRVYRMSCGIWEDTKYDRETKQSVPVAWYVTWDVYVTPQSRVMAKRLPGRIRNATRTRPPLKSIWKAGKKPTPIYSRKFPRRYQNSMSTILPCMEHSCRGTRWRVRNRQNQTAPPPKFRRAVFLYLKSRRNLLCWESCLLPKRRRKHLLLPVRQIKRRRTCRFESVDDRAWESAL